MSIKVEAPVGGWNAYDSLDDMPAEDAVILENWIPDSGYCRLRGGSQQYASGLGGEVKTLREYHAGGTRKFLAAANGNIWDISDGDAPASLASGFTEDRWQQVHHGTKLIFVNGADVPQVFDGSAIGAADFTGTTWGSSSASNFIGVNTFKGRAFYWEKESQDFWYAQAGSYQGQLTKFPLGQIVQKGGNLIMMLTWTRDSGDGVDDLAVFYYSSGEVLIYQGDDPGDSQAWALVGRFQLGEPLDVRGRAKMAGDEVIVTKDGYLNLGAALSNGRMNDRDTVSKKINAAVKSAVGRYSGNTGWQAILYPKGSLFLVNVPLSSSQYEQHVMNTNTGSWTKFTGWNGRCFGLFNDDLYFGVDGEVWRANVGTADGESLIKGRAITAFNYCGSRSRKKLLTAAEVVSTYLLPQYIGMTASSDFAAPPDPVLIAPPESGSSPWDGSEWDYAEWVQTEGKTVGGWRTAMAHGYAISLHVIIQSKRQSVKWFATKLKVKYGGEV